MAADFFDPLDSYPEAVAVPLEQALQEFRDFYGLETVAYIRQYGQMPDVKERKAACEARYLRQKFVEVRLFRSIMAAGANITC